MEYLILWLLFGLVGMLIGTKKGFSLPISFIAGIILGPLSFLMLLARSDKKKCPKCAEMVQTAASVCRFCNYSFDDNGKNADVKKATVTADTKKCPNCAEIINLEAKVCRFCNTTFTENEVEGEKQAKREQLEKEKKVKEVNDRLLNKYK